MSSTVPTELAPVAPAPQQQSLAFPQAAPFPMPWGAEDSEGGEGIRLSALLHSLRRQWLPALGIGMLAATAIAALLWLIIPIEFESEAMLRVSRELIGSTKSNVNVSEYVLYKETQAGLLKSPFVLNQALSNEEINNLRMIRLDDFGRRRKNPIAYLQKEVKVDLFGESELIKVRLRGKDKQETEKVLDGIVDAYMNEIVNSERVSKVELLSKLRAAYQKNNNEITSRSDEIQRLSKKSGSAKDSDVIKQEQEIRLREFQSSFNELERIRQDLTKARASLQMLQVEVQFSSTPPNELAIEDQLLSDPEYASVRSHISEVRDYLARMQQSGRANPAQLQPAQQELTMLLRKQENLREELTPRMIERIQTEKGNSRADQQKAFAMQQVQVKQFEQMLAQQTTLYDQRLGALKEYQGASGELVRMLNALSGLERDTQELQSRIQELVLEIDAPDRIRKLQNATTPNDSNWRLKLSEVMGAWILSFLGTVCAVAYWDFAGKRINNSSDLTRSAVRVIGTLPAIQQGGYLPFLNMGRQDLERAMNVSIDAVRTSILYSKLPADVVMVTSATGQEGRSTVTSQLAVSMARSGKRTLVVDADLRSPQQHMIFGINQASGLCEILRGESAADQAIQPTSVENVWLLCAGRFDPIALQGLSSERAGALFRELRDRFDVVIVDSSPVLTSADCLLVGQHADTTLISVRRDISQLPKVNAACDRLMSVSIRVMGAVVNGSDVERRRGELTLSPPVAEQPAIAHS